MAKLLKAESGSAVPASEISSVSPPRARKVAVTNSEQSSEIKSGGNIIKFKYFTIAFPKGTEYKDGRILFCYDKSCRHEPKNISETIEDYFVKLEDKCILDHTCLGRVKSVIVDKWQHVIQPTANGFPRKIGHLLAEVGDGCVLGTGFTEVDLDKLPSSEKQA